MFEKYQMSLHDAAHPPVIGNHGLTVRSLLKQTENWISIEILVPSVDFARLAPIFNVLNDCLRWSWLHGSDRLLNCHAPTC
jgi:hypothetical protein